MASLQRMIQRCQQWLAINGFRGNGSFEDPKLLKYSTLQRTADVFLDGFTIATDLHLPALPQEIHTMAATERGVGYEGAAAGKAFLDLSRSPFPQPKPIDPDADTTSDLQLCESADLLNKDPQYSFLMYLGIGEAMAQLQLPPILCNEVAGQPWSGQIVEGYGFFQGYFNWVETLLHQRYPAGLRPELRAAYDQGLGRAIYFAFNCEPDKIRDHINTFAPERRAELWAGVGIPTAYVGGLDERELAQLIDYSKGFRAELMQGVLLGSCARAKQNLIPDHTELACNIVCGVKSPESIYLNETVDNLLKERESYSMLDWQLQMRKLLRNVNA